MKKIIDILLYDPKATVCDFIGSIALLATFISVYFMMACIR